MKIRTVLSTIAALIICARAAATTPVALAPAGQVSRTVKAYDFVTVGFVAVNNSEVRHTFILSAQSGPEVQLVSAPAPFALEPGDSGTIPLTFSVSGNASGGQRFAVRVAITAQDAPGVEALSSVDFVVDSDVCGMLGAQTAPAVITNGKTSEIQFSISNCGSGRETFDISVTPDFGLELQDSPRSVELEAGRAKTLRFSVRPTNSHADYASSVRLIVSHNELTVAQAEITVNVKMPQKKKRSDYKYMPLKLSFENYMRENDHNRSSLRITIPTVNDGDTSLSTDVWMDSEDGRKYEAREQQFDFSHKHTRMIAGNQSVVLPETLHNRYETYEGQFFSQTFGRGALSFFNGNNSTNKIAQISWDQKISDRFTLRIGRVNEKSAAGEYNRLSANSLQASIAVSRGLTIKTEATRFDVSGGNLPADNSGMSYRLGGVYKSGKLQIDTYVQTGQKNIAASELSRGMEFRMDYDINNNRYLYVDFLRHVAFRAPAPGDASGALISYQVQSATAGYSQPFLGDTRIFSSIKYSDYGTMDNPLDPTGLTRDRSLSLRLAKQISSFNLYVERESGNRSNSLFSHTYTNNSYAALYFKNRVSFGIQKDVNSNFDLSSLETYGRSFTSSFTYTLPDNRQSFEVRFEKGINSNQVGGDTARQKLEFRVNSQFHSGDTLRFIYGLQSLDQSKFDTFSLTYSKTIDFKIPYARYGSISGLVYEDRNRNGRYDSDDIPLENVRTRAGGIYSAVTDRDGRFQILDVENGGYRVDIDTGTLPGGLARVPGVAMDVKVKNGKSARIDMPVRRMYRIGGRIDVDRSDYFFTNLIIDTEQIKLILKKDRAIIGETFADQNGYYYFEAIDPGTYEIALPGDGLPEVVEIYSAARQIVDFSGNQDVININFKIGPKRVDLTKTF